MHPFRLPALGRRLGIVLAVAIVALTLAGITPQPAAAADPVLTLRIRGAGTVAEVTGARRVNCSNSTPSIGPPCTARYGWGWIVELRATPAPGYVFAGWQGTPDPNPVHCDNADSSHFLASGNCRFQIWDHLGLEARFVDSFAPDTNIVGGPPSPTRETIATFSFSSNEAAARFECSLDNSGFSGCSSPRTYSGLVPGRHAFEVRAVDPSGNRDFSPARREWTIEQVDTVPPRGTVAINNGAAATKSRRVTLTLSATDPAPGSGVAGMRIRNAGGAWTAWQPFAASTSWTLTKGDGRKTVQVEYRDGAGNVSATASDRIRLK
jgi:hypothetical protein